MFGTRRGTLARQLGRTRDSRVRGQPSTYPSHRAGPLYAVRTGTEWISASRISSAPAWGTALSPGPQRGSIHSTVDTAASRGCGPAGCLPVGCPAAVAAARASLAAARHSLLARCRGTTGGRSRHRMKWLGFSSVWNPTHHRQTCMVLVSIKAPQVSHSAPTIMLPPPGRIRCGGSLRS